MSQRASGIDMIPSQFRAATVVVLVSLAACGSSTAPANRTEPIRLAFVDNLVQANCGSSVPLIIYDGYSGPANCTLPTGVVQAVGAGALPSRIRVTTASGSQDWSAIIVERYSPPSNVGGIVDSSAYVVLYRDTTFTYGSITTVQHLESVTAGGGPIYVNNAWVGNAGAFTGPTTTVDVGGPCHAASGLRTPLQFPIGDCRLATFTVSIPSFGDDGFGPISIATQTVGGVIVGPL
jgi:hypothetical protein